MLFFDRRRQLSRVLSPEDFKFNGSAVNSQTPTPSEPENDRAMSGRNSKLCGHCSSYACRWFPSLTLADWVLLQLVLCSLLLLLLFAVVGIHAHIVAKERFGYDIALLTRDLYTQARRLRKNVSYGYPVW